MTEPSTRNNRVPFSIRGAVLKDWPFVSHSWVSSYSKRGIAGRGHLGPYEVSPPRTSEDVYLDGQHALVTKLAQRTTALVACSETDPEDQLFGYIVFEPKEDDSLIHYLYVKECFRNMGIGRALYEKVVDLCEQAPTTVTHWTWILDKYVRRGMKLKYNPYRSYL